MKLTIVVALLWNLVVASSSSTEVSSSSSSSSTFPNPLHDAAACHADNTTHRICDRDYILTYTERQAIQHEIDVLETHNVTCNNQEIPVQMGIALVRTVREEDSTDDDETSSTSFASS